MRANLCLLKTVCAVWLLSLALPAVVQAQYTWTTNNGTITITSCNATSGVVIIPEAITDLPVTGIGRFAFYGSTGLTSVTIPASVTSIDYSVFATCSRLTNATVLSSVIGENMFAGCSSLTSVLLSSNITSIAQSAFGGCSHLTTISLPPSVTSIGGSAFQYSGLTSITIPSSVTSIGGLAFYSCASLASISVDPGNQNYSSVNGVLFNNNPAVLIQYPGGKPGSYTVPNGVGSIGGSAFSYSAGLSDVTIPNGVTSIGDSAFSDCAGLAGVSFPNSITNIGEQAFFRCSSLTSVMIPESVAAVRLGAFSQCTSLTNVTIPTGVTSIGDYAFSGCAGLANFTIPNSVTNIGMYAFSSSSKLAHVNVGTGVMSIGESAFRDCTNLASLTIPDSVTNIGINAFRSCYSLTNVTLGDGLSRVEGWTFSFCTNLVRVIFGKNITQIADYAFYGCSGLKTRFFQGDAPIIDPSAFTYAGGTVYYLPGTMGWGGRVGAILWNPQPQTSTSSFGVKTNRFGFSITGTSGLVIVVESATNLANSVWSPVSTNTLTSGTAYFSDPQWTAFPTRFYRIRSP